MVCCLPFFTVFFASTRNLSSPTSRRQQLTDPPPPPVYRSLLVPLYDSDTGMLFLAGKGDTSISYMEITNKEPFFVEGLKHTGEQTKGACLVPKRALNVMQAEVNRILQQTAHAVIPVTYQVPRKVSNPSRRLPPRCCVFV